MIHERRFTERLELIALTAPLAQLTVDAPLRLGEVLQATIPTDWPPPGFDHGAQTLLADRLQADPALAGWLAWLLVWHQGPEPVLVGMAGFKGMPGADGQVEIACGIVPTHQRRGLGTEACLDLIDWALADPAVATIVAEAPPDGTPAIRAMEKIGMTADGAGTAPGSVRYAFRRIGCASKFIPKP
jgi:RimJ/RimL family protein N-acetyltransferase